MNIELNPIDDFAHPADISDDERSLIQITEISVHNPKPLKPSSPHTSPYQTDTIQIPILSFSLNSESSTFKSILSISGTLLQALCCIILPLGLGPIVTITIGSVGLKKRFGKYTSKVGPGLYSYNPIVEEFIIVDMRAQIMDLPEQKLLTRDNVTLCLDAYVHYKVVLAERAMFEAKDYRLMVRFMTSGVMKTIIAEHRLGEILGNRKMIEKKIVEIIDGKTEAYGVKVIDIETQKIKLPGGMERAIGIVAEAGKQSEARIIDAKGNLQSAKYFVEAADELGGNPIAVQLQWYECLKFISAEKQSTIIVPDSVIKF
jgi:regulator of protease activity HflC (stomatin/prohibitin superfamily)